MSSKGSRVYSKEDNKETYPKENVNEENEDVNEVKGV